jgi:hypothetical protein
MTTYSNGKKRLGRLRRLKILVTHVHRKIEIKKKEKLKEIVQKFIWRIYWTLLDLGMLLNI